MLTLSETAELAPLVLLAVVQGLTEFLPVSSSGHLVIAQDLIDFAHPALAIDVALHVGTLLAVLIVYRRDVLAILRDVVRFELHEALLIVVGTIPAGLVGVLFKDQLEAIFQRTDVAAGGLLVTALVLLVGERTRRRNVEAAAVESEAPSVAREMTWKHALLIGTFQACAICPGVSRSGSTIAAGLLCRLPAARAARFSFLLSIPAILGAAVLAFPDALREESSVGATPILIAVLLAGAVGWLALRLLIAFLGRGVFVWFAAYCAIVSIAVFAFLV